MKYIEFFGYEKKMIATTATTAEKLKKIPFFRVFPGKKTTCLVVSVINCATRSIAEIEFERSQRSLRLYGNQT